MGVDAGDFIYLFVFFLLKWEFSHHLSRARNVNGNDVILFIYFLGSGELWVSVGGG